MVSEGDATGLDFIGQREFDKIQNKLINEFIVNNLFTKWIPYCEGDGTHLLRYLLTSQY